MPRKRKKVFRRVLVARDFPKSPISEKYRTLRTNLQFASIDQEIQSILVTSTAPEEGKSLTVANLAIVYAQQGKKVLLIDSDLRKPTLHYTFRLDPSVGLSNYLIGRSTIEQVITESNIDNLDLLPSGPIPPNPSELLGSKKMKTFLEEMQINYDLIIFDTPPVLAVTDSQILSNLVDGVLIVVRNKKTNREEAVRAKDLLLQANAKILGTILNDVDSNKKDYYYYGRI